MADTNKQPKNGTERNATPLTSSLATPFIDKRPLHLHLAKSAPVRLTKHQEKVREEQLRTKVKKKLFLEWWEKSSGVIELTCKQTDIGKTTLYRWLAEDKEFAAKVQEIEARKNNVAVDLLWAKVSIEKNIRAITYWLDRKHPDFKPKKELEVYAGERTLEDLIAEDAQKTKDGIDGQQSEAPTTAPHAEQQVSDRDAPEDTKQEGEASEVPAKPSAEVVLETQDQKKPDTQS